MKQLIITGCLLVALSANAQIVTSELQISEVTETTISGTLKANTIHGTRTGGQLRIKSNHGYLDLGPKDGAYMHFVTDRSIFNFNKNIKTAGNLYLKSAGFIDDDTAPGGLNDDYIQLRGYIEMRSSNENYGIVLRSKTAGDFAAITQSAGNSYFSDSKTYNDYFLRGNGRSVYIYSKLTLEAPESKVSSEYLRGNKIQSRSGSGGPTFPNGLVSDANITINADVKGTRIRSNTITNYAGTGKPSLPYGFTAQDNVTVSADLKASKLRSNTITDYAGTGAPNFSKGIKTTGTSELNGDVKLNDKKKIYTFYYNGYIDPNSGGVVALSDSVLGSPIGMYEITFFSWRNGNYHASRSGVYHFHYKNASSRGNNKIRLIGGDNDVTYDSNTGQFIITSPDSNTGRSNPYRVVVRYLM